MWMGVQVKTHALKQEWLREKTFHGHQTYLHFFVSLKPERGHRTIRNTESAKNISFFLNSSPINKVV